MEEHEKWNTRNDDGNPKAEKWDNSSPEMNDGANDVDREKRANVLRSATPAYCTGQTHGSKSEKLRLKRKEEMKAIKKEKI